MNSTTLLVADMGATHSRFAIISFSEDSSNAIELRCMEWFYTQQFGSFGSLMEEVMGFIGRCGSPRLSGAVFGVPGPVFDDRCAPPNISWSISKKEIALWLGCDHVWLINDFVAIAHSCGLLSAAGNPLEALQIWGGKTKSGPLAIVGAGSGLGKALYLPQSSFVLPSEGGHADFPFYAGEEEFEHFLQARTGNTYVEMESLLSGKGLAALFAFHGGEDATPTQVTEIMTEEGGEHAEATAKTLSDFACYYGRVCKNFILETGAIGGLCIAGGIATYIPVMQHPAFLQSLHESPTHNKMLQDIPVWHITSLKSGLLGAACFGAAMLQQK